MSELSLPDHDWGKGVVSGGQGMSPLCFCCLVIQRPVKWTFTAADYIKTGAKELGHGWDTGGPRNVGTQLSIRTERPKDDPLLG